MLVKSSPTGWVNGYAVAARDDDAADARDAGIEERGGEWRRLVLDRRVLLESSPIGWVHGTQFTRCLDQFRFGIEHQRTSDSS
jgi:hypothetical protein